MKEQVIAALPQRFYRSLAHRYTRNNPAQGLPLCDILKPMPKVEHRAAITKTLVLGQLIHDIDQTDSNRHCTIEANS